MSNQSRASNDKPPTIQDITREIETKSKGGGYIYRGERKLHKEHPYNGKVSSNLWREYSIEEGPFDIELVQKEMLAAAKKHTGDLPQDFRLDVVASPNIVGDSTQETIDFEILTEIQHYGGKTNLIDFTTDYFIALFFACDGRYDEDGRIILQKTDEIRNMIAHPRNPRHRVIVQKSVFIRPPKGFIEPRENEIVIIPSHLKQPMLEHLQNYHAIFTETIYNDLYGYIRNQDIHGDAYTQFYRGFACSNRADKIKTNEDKQREYEKSIEYYTKAIELKPNFPETYNNRGSVYRSKGDFDTAIEDCTQAIKLKSDFPEAYSNRGNAYADKGDFDTAIEDYTQAIKLKPDYANAYNNRGNVYRRKGDFDNAIEDYTQAIELNPHNAEVYYNRGGGYIERGDFDIAIKDCTQAIKLKPDYAEAYVIRGVAYADKGDFDTAIEDYTQAIELKSDFPEAYNNRGNAYANKGDFDTAIKDYTQVIKLKPDFPEAYSNRGVAYADKGDFDTAIEDYNKAIELKPDFPEAYYNRGEAWLHLKEWEKAKSDLMTAKNTG